MNKPAFPYPEGTNTWIKDWTFVATMEDCDVYSYPTSLGFLVVPNGHAPIWYNFFDRDGEAVWQRGPIGEDISRPHEAPPSEEVRLYVEALYQLHS